LAGLDFRPRVCIEVFFRELEILGVSGNQRTGQQGNDNQQK
jgi:hypothetical protein